MTLWLENRGLSTQCLCGNDKKDDGTQTPDTKDTGTGDDVINPSTDAGTQTDATVDGGTQTDSAPTTDAGTQTDRSGTTDGGTQTEGTTADSETHLEQQNQKQKSDSGVVSKEAKKSALPKAEDSFLNVIDILVAGAALVGAGMKLKKNVSNN